MKDSVQHETMDALRKIEQRKFFKSMNFYSSGIPSVLFRVIGAATETARSKAVALYSSDLNRSAKFNFGMKIILSPTGFRPFSHP